MLPCGNEILQEMNPPLQLQLLQINGDGLQHCLFDQNPTSSHHDDFFDQILSTTTPFPSSSSSSWSDPIKSPAWDHNNAAAGFHYDHENINLAPKLRQPQQHQINAGGDATTAMKMMMLMQQQMMLSAKPTVASAGGGNIIDGSLQAFYNGFADGSLQHPQASFGANYSPTEMKQSTQGSGSTAGNATAPEKPKQKVRARRGQATDPHSIAERLRRVRIAERMKSLQELVPNANKTDKASMLDEIIDYVKFLQLQVKVLSVSRLGGAAAVGPLVTTDIPSEGGGDCVQTSINGGSLPRNSDDKQTSTGSDNLTVTEHQVAKLMEEDMGSAMQYLQGKGLCLMPVSLASTISNVTCRSRNPMLNVANPNSIGNDNHLLLQSSGSDGPSSPNMSVLTVQSASMGNGGIDGAASVSKT